MSNYIVYGASDDLLEIETEDNSFSEEYSIWNAPIIVHAKNEDEELFVHASYINPGVWTVGVAPADEGEVLPDWGFTLGSDLDKCSYSTVLAYFLHQ